MGYCDLKDLIEGQRRLEVCVYDQQLLAIEFGVVVAAYPISTAVLGVGEQTGSYQTPRGRHYVRAKIGQGVPLNGVFVGRRFTGEVYNEALGQKFPNRDWILTRIMWLSGLESGFNRSGAKDSMRRYIYIHGTPDRYPMGEPGSKGCIRMRNQDVLTLYNWIPDACAVDIYA